MKKIKVWVLATDTDSGLLTEVSAEKHNAYVLLKRFVERYHLSQGEQAEIDSLLAVNQYDSVRELAFKILEPTVDSFDLTEHLVEIEEVQA